MQTQLNLVGMDFYSLSNKDVYRKEHLLFTSELLGKFDGCLEIHKTK